MTKKRADMSYVEVRESTAVGQQGMAAARLALSVRAMMQNALATSGVTQKELAVRLQVGESRVSQILSGDGNVQISTLAKVLRALGYKAELAAVPVDATVKPLPTRRRRSAEPAKPSPKAVHSDKKIRDRITVVRGSKSGYRVEAVDFAVESEDAEAFYVVTHKDVTTTFSSNGWTMELSASNVAENEERVVNA